MNLLCLLLYVQKKFSEIFFFVSVKDENLRRMMREMEYLTEDVNTLSQMVDLVATLHCPHGQIEENIREMLSALNKQLNDRHVSESQLSYLELALNTR